MSALPKLLSSLQDAILTGKSGEEKLYRDKPGFPPAKQLGVYQAAYRIRLQNAVTQDYPALHYYLKEKFAPLAEQYVAATPARHFNLDRYSLGFPQFLEGKVDAFAAELASLEAAIVEIYLGEESLALDAPWLARQPADALAAMPISLRKAARLMEFAYPTETYLADFRAGKNPSPPAAQAQYLAVFRHPYEVKRRLLEETEYALLSRLQGGSTLAGAFEAMERENITPTAEEVQKWFHRWVAEGMLRQPELP